MDFTLSKEHEMARQLFKEFAENEVNLLRRKLTRPKPSPERPLRRWLSTASWEFPFPRSTADRAVIP